MSEEGKRAPWSVKVTDDLRERLKNALDGSGLEGNDFMDSLVSLYEAEHMKASQPIMTQDIAELETITRRIVSMYVGLGERIHTLMDAKEQQAQATREQDRETIYLLHGKIKEVEDANKHCVEGRAQAQQEMQALQQHIEATESEYSAKVNGLTELLNTNRALVEEYKQKNDTLAGLIAEYKQYKEAHTAMQADVAAKERELQAVQQTHRASQHEIELLQTAMTDEHEKHKAELETLKEKLAFEAQKQLLQAEKDYQAQLQRVRDDYNQQIKDLFQQMQQPTPEKKTTRQTKA